MNPSTPNASAQLSGTNVRPGASRVRPSPTTSNNPTPAATAMIVL
nr:hypothetical protein [Pseudonocardia acaciae]